MKSMQHNDSVSSVDRAIREAVQSDPAEALDDISKRRLFDSVLAELAVGAAVEEKRRNRRVRKLAVFALGTAAAATAALVLWMRGPEVSETNVETSEAASVMSTPKTDVTGAPSAAESTTDNAPRMDDAGVIRAATRRVAVMLPTKIQLLLDPHAELEMGRMDDSEITVVLQRGKVLVSVDPDRNGPPFSVVTAFGSARVKGTIFSVDAQDRRTSVAVLRGKVETRGNAGRAALIKAGFEQRIGDAAPERISKEDQSVMAGDVADLAVLSRREDSRIDLTETFTAAVRPTRKETPPTSAELLKQARQLCIERRWQEAAGAYESLIRSYPSNAASVPALVSLGDLYLRRLKKPDAALASYIRYLDSNNPVLKQEALLGTAAALRAMGDHGREEKTLRGYLAQYPRSLQAAETRRRIAELENLRKK